jgi:hypothetical protein
MCSLVCVLILLFHVDMASSSMLLFAKNAGLAGYARGFDEPRVTCLSRKGVS